MNTKRDTLIFQLVKYLIDNDKQGNHAHAVTSNDAHTWKPELEVVMPSHDIQQQLESLNNTVAELKNAVLQIQPHSNGNEPAKPKELNGHASESNGIYTSIVNDLIEGAEYKLQNLVSGAFLANTAQNNFYLWSGSVNQNPCFVVFHCESPELNSATLSMIASNIINELQLNNPSDMMRLINRRMQDVFGKYPNIPQNIRVGMGMVNKKEAKVVFSGAGIDLYSVNDEEVQTFEGTQGCIGLPENQFQDQEVGIKRGQALYIASKTLITAGVESLWKETLDDSPIDKKYKTTKWLVEKKSAEIVLGLTF
jgi:hypothetical protein